MGCNFEHYGITTSHIAAAFRKLLSGPAVTRIDTPTHVSGTRHFEALAGMIDAASESNYDDMADLPKLDL